MLRILIGASLAVSVTQASQLDGAWKVVSYTCKSGRFKRGTGLKRPRFASFTFDTESKKAIMSFDGDGCLFVGELDLTIETDELKFSNYRPTSDCGEIESFSDFKSTYRFAPAPTEKLVLTDQRDEVCRDESPSEMELRRVNGS